MDTQSSQNTTESYSLSESREAGRIKGSRPNKKVIVTVIVILALLALGAGASWYWYSYQHPICETMLKTCPDGTIVSRSGPNCEFAACPGKNVFNQCGDGVCQEVTCLSVGCPLAETPQSCPDDCTGNGTASSPDPDSATAGWQTYRNAEYTFEFKYPSEWGKNSQIKEPLNLRITKYSEAPAELGPDDFALTRTKSDLSTLKQSIENGKGEKIIKLDDRNAEFIFNNDPPSGTLYQMIQFFVNYDLIEVWVTLPIDVVYSWPVDKDKIEAKKIQIQNRQAEDKVLKVVDDFNKILSTFKFTSPSGAATNIELTKETAISLLKNKLFDNECYAERVIGKYASCQIDILKINNNTWEVVVTYDGLYDDSIKANRTQATIIYQDGQWLKQDVSKTQQCWQERGHQDFSTAACL